MVSVIKRMVSDGILVCKFTLRTRKRFVSADAKPVRVGPPMLILTTSIFTHDRFGSSQYIKVSCSVKKFETTKTNVKKKYVVKV